MYPTELRASITDPTNGQASPQFTFNEERWQLTRAQLFRLMHTRTNTEALIYTHLYTVYAN